MSDDPTFLRDALILTGLVAVTATVILLGLHALT